MLNLAFVAGSVFPVAVLLIGAWLCGRWQYRPGSGRTLPPWPQHNSTDTPTTLRHTHARAAAATGGGATLMRDDGATQRPAGAGPGGRDELADALAAGAVIPSPSGRREVALVVLTWSRSAWAAPPTSPDPYPRGGVDPGAGGFLPFRSRQSAGAGRDGDGGSRLGRAGQGSRVCRGRRPGGTSAGVSGRAVGLGSRRERGWPADRRAPGQRPHRRPVTARAAREPGGCEPRRSDHAPFCHAGVPSMVVSDTAPLRNPSYHRPTDAPAPPRPPTTTPWLRSPQPQSAPPLHGSPERPPTDGRGRGYVLVPT